MPTGAFARRFSCSAEGGPSFANREAIDDEHNRDQHKAASLNAGRRRLLKLSGAAALLSAARLALPSGAFAQGAGPEVKGTRLGYIALTDASPLIIAKEKGLYAKYGLPDMDIAKQASWGATRDNMALGFKNNGIDGGHILRRRRISIPPGR